MPPMLPGRPSKDVDVISASWLCRLLDCVEWAMKYPEGDGKSIIRVGTSFRIIRQPGGGVPSGGTDEYKGYFKVLKVDDNNIRIVNGAAPENVKCGLVQVSSQNIELDAAEISISGAGHAYCRIYYDGTEYKAVLGAGSIPSVEKEVYIDLASYDATAKPSQVWQDGTINLNGDYVT